MRDGWQRIRIRDIGWGIVFLALGLPGSLAKGAQIDSKGEVLGDGRTVPENVATFSFVAHDPQSGISGVVVASKFLAVGSVVPWAEAGVGAIATQAFCNTTYGPGGLTALASGRTAQEVVDALTTADEGRASRQVGIVGVDGSSATHTGEDCMAWAGGRTGPGYAAQGNILTGSDVVDAMVDAFENSAGQFLGDRLLLALEAGDAAGGDSRGRQSSALLLVAAGKGYGGFNDRLCDLRVDEHTTPIRELRRIYNVWRPVQLINEGYSLVEEELYEEAIALGKEAAVLDPDSGDPYYHLACYHSRAGHLEDAMHYLNWALRLNPDLRGQTQEDPDLKPLREREDYRSLLES